VNKLSLFEAWASWCAGNRVDGSVLWWFTILWWGRIGKGLELFAGLTIIAEIIGPEGLRAFGDSLRTQKSFKHLLTRLFDQPLISGLGFFSILFALGYFVRLLLRGDDQLFLLISPVLAIPLMLVAMVALMIIFVVLDLLCSLADLLLRMIATAFQSPNLNRAIKLLGAFLLLLGFHFDLLSE
jgi:hypothetical protein